MNERRSFYRKLAYGAAMAALLFPLSLLSSPETVQDKGGLLAEMRSDNRLSQSQLGEIDPASETIKLATLGLRGVAVNLLWEKANYAKKTENWSELAATLEQLSKLQPNFVTFWKYQSWNLSYNVSVEFDDYRDRYYYVKRGIEFLEKGQEYNVHNPALLWELGWFLGQKIGRSDEKKQYRRLFKADEEYHQDRPISERDNWLVSKEWYLKSVDAADNKGRGIGRKSPVVFYSSAAKSQMNFAEAAEADGLFERGLQGWKVSADEWRDFGAREVEHSTGVKLRLGEQDYLEEKVAELNQQLEDLLPGTMEEIEAERKAQLSPEQTAALEVEKAKRTSEEAEYAYQAEQRMRVGPRELGERIGKNQPDLRREAMRQVAAIEEADIQLRYTRNYKDTANYDYWLTRATFEQTDNAVEARKFMYRAKREFLQNTDPIAASELYAKGFEKWRLVLDEFPVLLDGEGTTGDDILEYVKDYARVLEQLDETIPADFPLWDIIEEFDAEQDFTAELQEYKQRQQTK